MRKGEILWVVFFLTVVLLLSIEVFAEAPPCVEWNKVFNSFYQDGGRGIAVDGSGNVFVTGYSGDGPANWYYRTIKYNSAGSVTWNVTFNDVAGDCAYGIAVDGSGNVYVTGVSSGDYRTIKYNSAGGEVWNVTYGGGSTNDQGRGIAVDSGENVYVTGLSSNIPDPGRLFNRFFIHTPTF